MLTFICQKITNFMIQDDTAFSKKINKLKLIQNFTDSMFAFFICCNRKLNQIDASAKKLDKYDENFTEQKTF